MSSAFCPSQPRSFVASRQIFGSPSEANSDAAESIFCGFNFQCSLGVEWAESLLIAPGPGAGEGAGEESRIFWNIGLVDFDWRRRYTTIGPSSSSEEPAEGRGDGDDGGQFLALWRA